MIKPNSSATDYKISMGNTFFTKYFSVWDLGSQIDLVSVNDEDKKSLGKADDSVIKQRVCLIGGILPPTQIAAQVEAFNG